MKADLTDAERFAQAGAASLVRADFQLGAIKGRLALRPRRPEPGVRQGELDGDILDVMAIEPKRAAHLQGGRDLKVVPGDP